jgi:hypothetical protein
MSRRVSFFVGPTVTVPCAVSPCADIACVNTRAAIAAATPQPPNRVITALLSPDVVLLWLLVARIMAEEDIVAPPFLRQLGL